MADNTGTNDLSQLLEGFGIKNDPDWMAIVLFVRNLLTRLTVYSDEKKAEIQQEICSQLAKKDFSDDQYQIIMGMLDMYIMQNIGSLELEESLSREKRSAAMLLNEMESIITSMQGSNARQTTRLSTFKDSTVNAIQTGSKKSIIVSQVRGLFQELIQEFRDEARELNAKAKHFEQTASFDPLLSELHNRRAFDIYLEKTVSEQKDNKAPLSMMMIDVDHFKKVNDTYGHQVGDDVLRALAQILTAHSTLYNGFTARYGGEELIIVIKGLNLDTASIKAEAIRADVENYDFRVRTDGQLADDPVKFTVSIGVAQWQEGWSASSLLGAADVALYDAKDKGRNKVCCAKEKRP